MTKTRQIRTSSADNRDADQRAIDQIKAIGYDAFSRLQEQRAAARADATPDPDGPVYNDAGVRQRPPVVPHPAPPVFDNAAQVAHRYASQAAPHSPWWEHALWNAVLARDVDKVTQLVDMADANTAARAEQADSTVHRTWSSTATLTLPTHLPTSRTFSQQPATPPPAA